MSNTFLLLFDNCLVLYLKILKDSIEIDECKIIFDDVIVYYYFSNKNVIYKCNNDCTA